MHTLFRLSIRLALVALLLYICIKPYNWFCNFTDKCLPFYISDLSQKREVGDPFDVFFEVKNYNDELSFDSDSPVMQTVFNRKSTMFFYAKNNTLQTISFRPELVIEPVALRKYIRTYECPCSRKYTLKPGESVKVNFEFSVDSKVAENYNVTKAPPKYQGDSMTHHRRGEDYFMIKFRHEIGKITRN